ncbi:hypothetical protein ACLM5H_04955 [Fredinandcohnia humi]
MAVTVANADIYFNENVLHNEEWVTADEATKQRALNNAKKQLYRIYKTYNEVSKPLPDEAIYLQALWLLRLDDAVRKAEQGVRSVSVSGITVTLARQADFIAPEVVLIVGRRVGRTVL